MPTPKILIQAMTFSAFWTYAIGSFITWQPDPSLWTPYGRVWLLVVFAAGVGSAVKGLTEMSAKCDKEGA